MSSVIVLFEHDLFGKPVSTFPDHALRTLTIAVNRRPPRRHQHTMAFWSDQGAPVRGNTAFRRLNCLIHRKHEHFLSGTKAFCGVSIGCNIRVARVGLPPGSKGATMGDSDEVQIEPALAATDEVRSLVG